MPNVVNRGCRIGYAASGDGPPLLLVAGFSQWADQWVDAGYTAVLEPSYRVIRVDPLGHGRSDKPHQPEPYRLADLVQDLVAVLDAEDTADALCWGYSMGGTLVRDLAHAHPERVRAVVTGDSVPFRGRLTHPVMADMMGTEQGLIEIWSMMGFTDPDDVAAALAMNDAEALRCLYEGIGDGPVYDRVDAPVLAYTAQGWTTPNPWVETFLENTKAERHALEGANHYTAFTRSNEVLSFVEPFLAHHAA